MAEPLKLLLQPLDDDGPLTLQRRPVTNRMNYSRYKDADAVEPVGPPIL